MSVPGVSVVMPVYNAARYLPEALDSVLRQTYSDLELVIVDDGSTDASMDIVRRRRDPRITVVTHAANEGLAAARNTGLEAARGDYVAWLDADDACAPTRIAQQVHFLESHEDVAICGTWVETIGEVPGLRWRYPVDDAAIRSRMLFDNPFATSSLMLRRRVLAANDLRFDLGFPPAEDYELWERVLGVARGANLPRFLSSYRLHGAQTSAKNAERQRANVWRIQARQLHRLGVRPSPQEQALHLDVGVGWRFDATREALAETKRWLTRLLEANGATRVYPERAFARVVRGRWRLACAAASGLGLHTWRQYATTSLSGSALLRPLWLAKLLAKCALAR